MSLDQVVKLIATGGAVGLVSATAMAVIVHRLSQKSLEQQLAAQRDAFERQLEQESCRRAGSFWSGSWRRSGKSCSLTVSLKTRRTSSVMKLCGFSGPEISRVACTLNS